MTIQWAAISGAGRLVLAWLLLALASPDCATAALRYEALAISAPKALALAPDPRFDPSDRGTVEFWLAIAPLQPRLAPQIKPATVRSASRSMAAARR